MRRRSAQPSNTEMVRGSFASREPKRSSPRSNLFEIGMHVRLKLRAYPAGFARRVVQVMSTAKGDPVPWNMEELWPILGLTLP